MIDLDTSTLRELKKEIGFMESTRYSGKMERLKRKEITTKER